MLWYGYYIFSHMTLDLLLFSAVIGIRCVMECFLAFLLRLPITGSDGMSSAFTFKWGGMVSFISVASWEEKNDHQQKINNKIVAHIQHFTYFHTHSQFFNMIVVYFRTI